VVPGNSKWEIPVNAYWRPVMPFVGTDQGMVLFPVSVEVANSLLRSCEILDKNDTPEHFSRFESRLQRYFDWLLARVERGECDGKKFVGWHSEHVNERGTIHLWETSQVVLFLVHYAAHSGDASDQDTNRVLHRNSPTSLG
jgi:hypothetical protein